MRVDESLFYQDDPAQAAERDDRLYPPLNSNGPRDGGSEAQPHDDWMGQLLLSGQGLSGAGKARLPETPTDKRIKEYEVRMEKIAKESYPQVELLKQVALA